MEKSGVVEHIYSPRIWEVEAGEQRIPEHHGTMIEPVCKSKNKQWIVLTIYHYEIGFSSSNLKG